jgi:hypothetical protein
MDSLVHLSVARPLLTSESPVSPELHSFSFVSHRHWYGARSSPRPRPQPYKLPTPAARVRMCSPSPPFVLLTARF